MDSNYDAGKKQRMEPLHEEANTNRNMRQGIIHRDNSQPEVSDKNLLWYGLNGHGLGDILQYVKLFCEVQRCL